MTVHLWNVCERVKQNRRKSRKRKEKKEDRDTENRETEGQAQRQTHTHTHTHGADFSFASWHEAKDWDRPAGSLKCTPHKQTRRWLSTRQCTRHSDRRPFAPQCSTV